MANTKDITVENVELKILVYGDSGTGKTTFLSTFPNLYVFDFDVGVLSIRGKDVEYDVYYDEDLYHPTAYSSFERKIDEFFKDCPYTTIGIDSLTTLQRSLMNEVQFLNKKHIGKNMSQEEWGITIGRLERLFYKLIHAPCHLVVTAHEIMTEDPISGEITNRPLVYGKKLPGMIPLWFGEVYRTQIEYDKDRNRVYKVLTAATRRYMAKSRLRCFEELEEPRYDTLMKRIGGEKSA